MASRLTLHNKLEELNKNKNVYYQPPESIKMNYPAIRYSKKNIISSYADNEKYKNKDCYEIMVITKQIDPQNVDELLKLKYCSFDRHYVSNNLNHYSLTLYW